MKSTGIALVLVLITGLAMAAMPAHAGIVEVTTSVTIPPAATDDDVKEAVQAAARDALSDVPLEPVMIVLTAAYLAVGRLHVRFLIADEDGARQLGVRGGAPETQFPGPHDHPEPLNI